MCAHECECESGSSTCLYEGVTNGVRSTETGHRPRPDAAEGGLWPAGGEAGGAVGGAHPRSAGGGTPSEPLEALGSFSARSGAGDSFPVRERVSLGSRVCAPAPGGPDPPPPRADDSAQSVFPREARESHQEQSRKPDVPASAHVSPQRSPARPGSRLSCPRTSRLEPARLVLCDVFLAEPRARRAGKAREAARSLQTGWGARAPRKRADGGFRHPSCPSWGQGAWPAAALSGQRVQKGVRSSPRRHELPVVAAPGGQARPPWAGRAARAVLVGDRLPGPSEEPLYP